MNYKMAKTIPSRSDCDPTILRIYDLICKRRKMTEVDWAKLFGRKSFKASSSKWKDIETVLNVLDRIISADNLYKVCRKCGHRNPFDVDYSEMTDKEVEEHIRKCEGCNENLFKETT